MSLLPNATLGSVVVPGTHNSGCNELQHNLGRSELITSLGSLSSSWKIAFCHYFPGALYCSWQYACCQHLDVLEQLEKGIRFLDVRLRVFEDGKVRVSHTLPSESTFVSVLSQIGAFLNSNVTESVLVELQPDWEHRRTYNSGIVTEIIRNSGVNFKYVDNMRNVKLSEIAGHCILIADRHVVDSSVIPVVDTSSALVAVSQLWRCDDVSDCKRQLKDIMGKPFMTDERRINIVKLDGPCSGIPKWTRPKLNEWFFRKLSTVKEWQDRVAVNGGNDEEDGRSVELGIIAMDFPTDEIINKIIRLNLDNNT